ncbi:relaxase/mobilization nuclease domain-containing protein [Mucilaginibacter rubeus]|uniref:Relaxase/mobilization nuclease domain-containing protein n=1 Tax=Mucilaginibacter rubeus TaxID=2027860 RepID=A0AAE6MJT8_9SPHI|nr:MULTISPECIES: relaxase/mobilization nuclease domain-containing protein [Mucilaginibacter]QEM05557.1 relaxase/mobilization nuclease domain-containing protein [Mucilaginibacter rubeus]QEM18144.1 relaxase/mobilization nuclease domain-containing protein [Mucilaginibacter gossypii]QTE45323.1 relaxase/mobilization nuclease domain-containing protein [Mucilaginibacter rubeus]QTE51919.1 relaxase/mobilization nuclease domain-containing protein [Mucilaginibacter rubeus]QTE57007.1 relaxase/mobilization
MIGKVGTGKSFRGVLHYLFEGRRQESKELQMQELEKKQVEVIAYNQCFGTRLELVREMIEVAKLNPDQSKPVFHFSLSFAHSDAGKLGLQDKIDMVEMLAEKFDFKDHQYVVVAHKDTDHEHLHIVANRIGFDGKTASDSNSYKHFAEFARKMELEYKLEQVLSPNKFLKPEQRVAQSQRVDNRKETLRKHLQTAIKQSKDVQQVKKYMEQRGYEVELGRGIAFTDAQHVRFKGSQVGYALMDIEKKLKQEQLLRQQQEQNRQVQLLRQQQEELKKQQQQEKEQQQQVHQHTPSIGR